MHLPLPLQGSGEQVLITEEQSCPVNPDWQVQLKLLPLGTQVAPFLHGFNAHGTETLQVNPEYPRGQEQEYPPVLPKHVPPFMQGLGLQ